jgi:uncharacterized cupin superfamily protein
MRHDRTGRPVALAGDAAPLVPATLDIPAPHAARMAGLERRALSAPFGVAAFGVFQTRVPPGGMSGLRHRHSRNEEFVYVLEGEAVLVGDEGETVLSAGMCAGFPAGSAHHLLNRSDRDLVYLDVTHAAPGDEVEFPDDDLTLAKPAPGRLRGFARKDGQPL